MEIVLSPGPDQARPGQAGGILFTRANNRTTPRAWQPSFHICSLKLFQRFSLTNVTDFKINQKYTINTLTICL